MKLTKRQIKSLINKIGHKKAALIITTFFDGYRHSLSSVDVAALYDDEYFSNALNRHRPMTYDYVGSRINPDTKILDIGCGDGEFVFEMAKKGAFYVTGVDRDRKLILEANKLRVERKIDNCSIKAGRIEELSFFCLRDLDFVTMNDVSEHLSDDELSKAIYEFKSFLAPDGELVIYTPNGLSLCCQTDHNWISDLYRLVHGDDFVKSEYQLYYDQVHINVKSYRQLKKLLNSHGFTTAVQYEPEHRFPLWKQLSSKMLVIARLK